MNVYRRSAWRESAAFGVILFLFLAYLSDYDGYEGDDINLVMPMLTLAEVHSGWIWAYKYDWQPLSYIFGAGLYTVFGTPAAIFVSSAAAMALATTVIYHLLRATAGVNPLLALALILTVPEIVFTGLYYNSLSAPIAAIAWAGFLVLRSTAGPSVLAAGVLIGLAALLRVDFLMVSPLLAAIAYANGATLLQVTKMAVAAILVLAAGIVAGILDPIGAWDVYVFSTEQAESKAEHHGWDDFLKHRVIAVIFSPADWALLFLGSACWAFTADQQQRRRGLIIAIGAVPMALPLFNLLSVKYMMPALILWPLPAALFLKGIEKAVGHPKLVRASFIAGTSLFLFVSADPMKAPPFVRLAIGDSVLVGSHDGPRSHGAYLNRWLEISKIEGYRPSGYQDGATELATRIEGAQTTTLGFIGHPSHFREGSFAWRALYIRLAYAGYRPEVPGRGHLILQTPGGPVHLFADEAAASAANLALGDCLVRLFTGWRLELLNDQCVQ